VFLQAFQRLLKMMEKEVLAYEVKAMFPDKYKKQSSQHIVGITEPNLQKDMHRIHEKYIIKQKYKLQAKKSTR